MGLEYDTHGRANVEEESSAGFLYKRVVLEASEWIYAQASNIIGPEDPDKEHLIESENGAVSCDVEICSNIGVNLMKQGGNAIDAAVGEWTPSCNTSRAGTDCFTGIRHCGVYWYS